MKIPTKHQANIARHWLMIRPCFELTVFLNQPSLCFNKKRKTSHGWFNLELNRLAHPWLSFLHFCSAAEYTLMDPIAKSFHCQDIRHPCRKQQTERQMAIIFAAYVHIE